MRVPCCCHHVDGSRHRQSVVVVFVAATATAVTAAATITATTAFEFAAFASMTLRGWRDVAEPFPYPQTKRHGAGLKHASTR